MRAVIPFKKENAKSRLSEVLLENQRQEFALKMLYDVITSLVHSGQFNEIDILNSSVSSVLNTDFPPDVNVLVSEKNLNDALNEYLDKAASHSNEEILIIMADMPLVTEKQICQMTDLKGDVVISAGSRGGTNALLIRRPDVFYVDYYGLSFLDHLRIAKETELEVNVYDSFLVSTDMDEPDDLIELMIHGRGRAMEYLKTLGISLDTNAGTLDLSKKIS
ncbi:MAG: 2-phospho-L-lactate guanylyltransferase [ANME-2 cluster archaeon]|nr:2-phospho-L-lactate guanylyltransferase [ANME-2 cluster archaeon]